MKLIATAVLAMIAMMVWIPAMAKEEVAEVPDCGEVLSFSGEVGLEMFQNTDSVRTSHLQTATDTHCDLVISSPGGDTDYGIGIYDMLREASRTRPVRFTGYGQVASAAILVFLAADTRILMCNAAMLIHEPRMEISGNFSAVEASRDARILAIDTMRYVKIVAERTGLHESKVRSLMGSDTYITAQEAVDLGFAHKVVGCND